MNNKEIIQGLRLQSPQATPDTEFISNLRKKLMKENKNFMMKTLPMFFGIALMAVVGVVIAVAVYAPKEQNAPAPIQTNPTVTVTPSAAPTNEVTPVTEKNIQKQVVITYNQTKKATAVFTYPESKKYEIIVRGKINDIDYDDVRVFENGKEFFKIGINWVGFTGGAYKIKEQVLITTKHLGNVYRYRFNDSAMDQSWAYAIEKSVKTTGKCSGNGSTITAPCIGNLTPYYVSDLVSAKRPDMYMMVDCKLGSEKVCDALLTELEIK